VAFAVFGKMLWQCRIRTALVCKRHGSKNFAAGKVFTKASTDFQ